MCVDDDRGWCLMDFETVENAEAVKATMKAADPLVIAAIADVNAFDSLLANFERAGVNAVAFNVRFPDSSNRIQGKARFGSVSELRRGIEFVRLLAE